MARYGRRRGMTMVAWMLTAVGVGVWVSAAVGAETASAAAEVNAAFTEAMRVPLGQRAGLLEKLTARIEDQLSAGVGDVKARSRLVHLKYRSQVALAKYTDAHETFGRYARQLKSWDKKGRARATLVEFIRSKEIANERAECVAVAAATLEHWPDDEAVAPAALYYKALSLSRMPGRGGESIPVLEKIIQDFPGNSWRPKAMRLLGHLQANGLAGGHGAALATLRLIEQQYAGTWWAHYAHMKPAMIYEVRQGNPQAALQRFQESLRKFPDHKYATFIRGEIERLQKVIETQLIQDALDDLAEAGPDECDRPTTMIVRLDGGGQEHVSLAQPAK